MSKIAQCLKLLIGTVLMLCVASCESTQTQKPFSIYWHDNNLCVTMPHPTSGIIELGKVDWGGVDLNQVVSDIFNECNNSKRSGEVTIWVRFENPQTDKYGNVTMAYDDHQIATILLSEARKYKSGKFLDTEYKLSQSIYNAAFGSTDNESSFDDYNEFDKELEELRKRYIAPTDTLDF